MVVGDGATDSDSVDKAMNQVLAVEREARDAIARCRTEAAQILAAAEEDARRIAQRTERRIKLAHRIADQAVAHTLGRLQGPESLPGIRAPDEDVPALLDRAVDDLVEEILAAMS